MWRLVSQKMSVAQDITTNLDMLTLDNNVFFHRWLCKTQKHVWNTLWLSRGNTVIPVDDSDRKHVSVLYQNQHHMSSVSCPFRMLPCTVICQKAWMKQIRERKEAIFVYYIKKMVVCVFLSPASESWLSWQAVEAMKQQRSYIHKRGYHLTTLCTWVYCTRGFLQK